MTVTPEELLRLARKAWPDDCPRLHEEAGWLYVIGNDITLLSVRDPARFHSALLVLSGELDVAALLAERDRLSEQLAARDVCEACGDCLQPERPRCERHVHTEPGDPGWTMEDP